MASPDVSDSALLGRWCEGEEEAGDVLLRRWFSRLYRFFINKAGDATEDLVQQTLMGCFKHREQMHDQGTFRLYMFRIARSRLYDHLRAIRRRNGYIDDDIGSLSVSETIVSNTSWVGQARAAMEIRLALRRLPVDLQVVVEMHYWDEQSTAQIAEVLEVPQGTVKSRLRRARTLLEEELSVSGAEVFERVGKARPDVDDLT